jgi:hypothetical protein
VIERPSAPRGDLQFDKVEPTAGSAAGPATCGSCQQPLASLYYQANGQPVCERCKAQLEYDRMSSSGPANLVRAGAFGFLAAVAGGALWYAVRATTGYEIGLIAIVVGVMVGAAVRAGSRRRGGRLYQVLAVALTYFGICVQYVPDIVKAIREMPAPDHQAAVATPGAAVPAAPTSAAVVPAGAAPAVAPAPTVNAAATPATPPSGSEMLLAVAGLLALAMAAPFLGGIQNVIGILIIGFALWEAWKINRHVPLQIEGPFRVAPPASGAAPR